MHKINLNEALRKKDKNKFIKGEESLQKGSWTQHFKQVQNIIEIKHV